MKLKDLKPGADYAVGSTSWHYRHRRSRVRVVAIVKVVGKPAYCGANIDWRVATEKDSKFLSHRQAVLGRAVEDDGTLGPQRIFTRSQEFHTTWAEHEKTLDKIKEHDGWRRRDKAERQGICLQIRARLPLDGPLVKEAAEALTRAAKGGKPHVELTPPQLAAVLGIELGEKRTEPLCQECLENDAVEGPGYDAWRLCPSCRKEIYK